MKTLYVRLRPVLAAALAALCGAAHPLDAHALDVTGAFALALQSDPDIAASEQARLAAAEQAVQGRARWLPRIALSTSVRHLDERDGGERGAAAELDRPDRAGTMAETAVQLTQPLIDARATAQREQGRLQADQAEQHHRQARQALVRRVAESALDLLLARENLALVHAEMAAVTMQGARAQARFEVGRGKLTEVQETQARVDAVRAREVAATGTLAQREARFEALTGARAAQLPSLRDDASADGPQGADPDGAELVDWQARAIEQSPQVLLRRGDVAMASAAVQPHTASGRPTLELVARYGIQHRNGGLASGVSAERSRSAMVGVQWEVPLYAGGALDSRLREALARRTQAERELDAALRDVRLQVHDAYLAVHTSRQRQLSAAQSMRSAATALEATTLGRDLGTRTELDVLDAQQRLYAARQDGAQARHDLLLGRIRLAAAAGELAEDDLVPIDRQLAP